MNMDLAYMTAVGAIHAHPSADFEKAAAQVNNMWFDALNNMPYISGGKTGADAMEDERLALIERYKKIKLEKKTPVLQERTDTE